jgi:glycyl-tRNA synthetase
LFAVGLAPKATADPFALRRAALGIVQTLIERDMDIDLPLAIHRAAETQQVEASAKTEREVLEFIDKRMEQWLLDNGARHDLVQAALSARGANPAGASRVLRELAELADTDRFKKILTAYSRPARIVRGQKVGAEIDPDLFEHDEERQLLQAGQTATGKIKSGTTLEDFLAAFEPLCEPIDKFFDEVFVMAEDEKVKNNRMALLKHIADLAEGIVDFSKIQGF